MSLDQEVAEKKVDQLSEDLLLCQEQLSQVLSRPSWRLFRHNWFWCAKRMAKKNMRVQRHPGLCSSMILPFSSRFSSLSRFTKMRKECNYDSSQRQLEIISLHNWISSSLSAALLQNQLDRQLVGIMTIHIITVVMAEVLTLQSSLCLSGNLEQLPLHQSLITTEKNNTE